MSLYETLRKEFFFTQTSGQRYGFVIDGSLHPCYICKYLWGISMYILNNNVHVICKMLQALGPYICVTCVEKRDSILAKLAVNFACEFTKCIRRRLECTFSTTTTKTTWHRQRVQLQRQQQHTSKSTATVS